MTVSNNILQITGRLGLWLNLLFFVPACTETESTGIYLMFSNQKAKRIGISKQLVPGFTIDSAIFLRTSLQNDTTAILGDYRLKYDIIFEPLFAFTPGKKYEVWYRKSLLGSFSTPFADTSKPPELIAIYPRQDSLPENLLKVYLHFTHPMREGTSAKYITLTRKGNDTVHGAFLDLQPELWNEDRTVLTLWLDPGRIKRDLQPNLRLGTPLQEKSHYRLTVSPQWQDVNGVALQKESSKFFIAINRDSLSPRIDDWKIQTPKAGSHDPLTIDLPEPLDHFLLMEILHVVDKNGRPVGGEFSTGRQDTQCSFKPDAVWEAGNYELVAESMLEDLAGNNLNKSFDRDITKTKKPSTQRDHRRNFRIDR